MADALCEPWLLPSALAFLAEADVEKPPVLPRLIQLFCIDAEDAGARGRLGIVSDKFHHVGALFAPSCLAAFARY